MNSFLLFACSLCILFGVLESTGGKGMTWSLIPGWRNSALDVDAVSCNNCNAYVGDTSCNTKLPILCFSTCNFKRPPYQPIGCTTCAMSMEAYDGWSGGMFKLTDPVLGTSLLSSSNMNKICQNQFGSSFVAAYHSMGRYVVGMSPTKYYYGTWPTTTNGGGWGARGYGNLNTTSRFWVYISDQPSNCWNP